MRLRLARLRDRVRRPAAAIGNLVCSYSFCSPAAVRGVWSPPGGDRTKVNSDRSSSRRPGGMSPVPRRRQ